MKYSRIVLVIALAIMMSLMWSAAAFATQTKAHAVLFFSPRCPHCSTLLKGYLASVAQRYDGTVAIAAVNTDYEQGAALLKATLRYYEMTDRKQGVPAIAIGGSLLLGDKEIRARFDSLLREGIDRGGVAWPDIPGLSKALERSGLEKAWVAEQDGISAAQDVDALAASGRAVSATAVGGLVLISLCASVVVRSLRLRLVYARISRRARAVGLIITVVAGCAVAGYLAISEVARTDVLCPLGDCSVVQASEYSHLFGVSTALIGVLGFATIGIAFLCSRLQSRRVSRWGRAVLIVSASVAVGASMILTAIEVFVIEAVCGWCMTSALLAAVALVLTAESQRMVRRVGPCHYAGMPVRPKSARTWPHPTTVGSPSLHDPRETR
jgi:uncharacterized membrane protein